MKIITILGLCLFLIVPAAAQAPEEVLSQAKSTFFKSNRVAFTQVAYGPNMSGGVDTITTAYQVLKNENSLTAYDAVLTGPIFNNIYINGDYTVVNNNKKVVQLFTDQKPEHAKAYLEVSSTYSRSPMILLKNPNWEYAKDTLIEGQTFKNYYEVTNNKVVNGNTIYTEEHMFLNSKTKLLERWERRNYFKGNLSQRVVYTFSDYIFSDAKTALSYTIPPSYPSMLFSQQEEVQTLAIGTQAPVFSLKDLQNNTINLADYKGKKVLLKFSSVNCVNSHEALQYMMQDSYSLPDNTIPIYLSVWDKKEALQAYFTKYKTTIAVIPNADQIADQFGASATPTFFLIDEQGAIEKSVVGNNKEFLDGLKN